MAEPFMKDPNFKRTVVLLCEHNDQGSFGLVMNRKLDMKLDHVLPEFPVENIDLFYGGPVSPDTLHFIHAYGDLIEGSIQLMEDVWWGGNFEQVKLMFEAKTLDASKFRFFVGYSGWSAEQLDGEMQINSWIVARAFKDVFMPEDELWAQVLRQMGGEYKLVAGYPEDPQLN